MSCRNCGFIDLLPLEPPLQNTKAIHSSDNLVSQILRGSRPLLDSDHALLNSEIVELEQLHSLCDAQFQEIRLRRRAVLEALESRKSVYAPIRRLPRDILIEIFHLVCDSWYMRPNGAPTLAIERANSLDLSGPLWVLGRVCGLWRNTLHTSPASWARNIVVKSPFSYHANEILQTYLERIGEHLFNLRVFFRFAETQREREDEIMSLLVQSCQRWKNLVITIDKHHMHHFESISQFPALQTIALCIDDGDDPDYHPNMCVAAPQLRQATVYGQGIHQMRLPPGITHYSGGITCSEDLHLLSQLPNLRTSVLWMCQDAELAPVVVAQLRHLCVEDADVLDTLTTPFLSSLAVSDTGELAWTSSAQESVTRFLHRSRCHLESLSIGRTIFGSLAKINEILTLEACSTISRLKLELPSPIIDVTEDLASYSFPPNLHHLVLCLSHPSEDEWFAILHVVRSRRDAGVLKLVEVQFEGDQYENYMEEDIRALTVDDFEMRIGQPPRDDLGLVLM
ncbi:uncharacterized protein EV420DRAFT_1750614 [Desarmillaria tabescens]|uniref:F-box domain-containing protein n=1 Tax=Armillaria tabescens TaxID=1929756 RepID=A0AA39JVF9_ARMTA|nr:uncharacterized protein EV420DRAFT_1750614 [Desarmillaria tabescens]KAK0449534.1 hypothetical protein EV420DRAFT_1750614 [Desarmillaria tabescens]